MDMHMRFGPPSQTNTWLEAQRQRRARSDAWHQAARVRRSRARVDLVELVEVPDGVIPQRSTRSDTRELDAVTDELVLPGWATPPAPLLGVARTYPPEAGGCARCHHNQPAHRRGKDTPTPCTGRVENPDAPDGVARCVCPGFKRYRSVGDWLGLAALVVAVLVVAGGVAYLLLATLAARGVAL